MDSRQHDSPRGGSLSRRGFLLWGAGAVIGASLPRPVLAAARRKPPRDRSLSFYNLHTEETLETVYWDQGRYQQDALRDIDWILRDHRTGQVKPIDRELLDLLFSLRERLGCTGPFQVISGYRSPETNRMLRSRSRGVAHASLHLEGKAVDVRLEGCSLWRLRRAALNQAGGGVGYYPGPQFVHLDTGRVRFW